MKKSYRLIFNNPELTRNLWQEMSWGRLIVPPFLLVLVLMLIYLNTVMGEYFYEAVLSILPYGFFLITLLWGARLASSSLTQEITEGTWDTQRMSGQAPFKIMLGKLIGGVAIAWYIGIMLLAVILFAGTQLPSVNIVEMLKIVLAIVIATLSFHALSISSVLAVWRKGGRDSNKKLPGSTLGMLFIIGIFFFVGSRFVGALFELWGTQSSEPSTWFNLGLKAATHFLVTTIFIAVVFFISLWQQFRLELGYKAQPLWWLLILGIFLFYLAGFFVREAGGFDLFDFLDEGVFVWLVYCLTALFFVMLSVYFQLFGHRKDIMWWLHLSSAYKSRNRRKLISLFPNWAVSYLVAFVLGVIFVVLTLLTNEDQLSSFNSVRAFVFVGGVFCFVLRDIALVLWFNLAEKNKRADGAAVLCLVVLYVAMPWFASSLFFGEAKYFFIPALHLDTLRMVAFIPIYLLVPALQALAMIVFLWIRLNARKEDFEVLTAD